MPIMLYNTLTRSKEELKPVNDNALNIFVCGLTPYDDAHMGHAKTFVDFDVIVRWLRHRGYKVRYVQNITDIEDKIINRARERGIEPVELERHYEKRFMDDMEALGARQAVDLFPRSTDYIEAMRSQIQLLLDKGYAYQLEQDVYYDVSKFKDYTKLSGMRIEELEKHRIELRQGKRNPYDFALWKGAKEGEPSWKITLRIDGRDTEFVGRPGWHIEDTAMTHEIFGPQYDIHGGASELIFPHHSNEIAQAEAAFGVKPFVRYWLHTGIVNINNAKMSKSLGNFVTIREVVARYGAEAVRMLCATTHYSKEMNYTDALILDARKRNAYMYSALSIFYGMREAEAEGADDAALRTRVALFVVQFGEAMDDNFNTPLALSRLMAMIGELRVFAGTHSQVSASVKAYALSSVLELAQTLGILTSDAYKHTMPAEAEGLVRRREALRKDGRFNEADALRSELRKRFGIALEDTEYGSAWYFAGA